MDELTVFLLEVFDLGDGEADGSARLTFVARGAEGRVSRLEGSGLRYAVKQPFAVDAG